MANWQGFWSYVHADDDAESGRVSRLAKDVAAQFQMLTGEPLALFLDRDAVKWGEGWRDKIDSGLESVAFFIPVVTPRYLMSAECRRELQYFARQATRLGIKDLILPLHYVDCPVLRTEDTKDDLVALLRTFQWEDWRELRFADLSTEAYRRAVARLASRLVEANKQVESGEPAAASAAAPSSQEAADDAPGTIDRLAITEEALPQFAQTLEKITVHVQTIAAVMREATEEMQQNDRRGGKGFAGRVFVARKVARALLEPAEQIWTLGNDFAAQLHSIDDGIRTMIEGSADELARTPDSKQTICNFFSTIRTMSGAAKGALSQSQTMINAISPLEKMSRDLRPVLRRIRQGLTTMIEGQEVTDEWVHLIERSGVECAE